MTNLRRVSPWVASVCVPLILLLPSLAWAGSDPAAAGPTQQTRNDVRLSPPWTQPAAAEPRLFKQQQPHDDPRDNDARNGDEEEVETLVLEEEPYEPPMPAATLWTLFAWELGLHSDFDRGVVFEIGAEFGLPWRTSGIEEEFGIIPALSASFAGGFRGYTYRDAPFQSWSVSVNVMAGMGFEYPAGTLLFGPMLRWELAFRPLRTAPGGTSMIGASGVHALSVGAYIRFMVFDDRLPFPLPISLYFTADLDREARREFTVAVDLGGLMLLGWLFGQR